MWFHCFCTFITSFQLESFRVKKEKKRKKAIKQLTWASWPWHEGPYPSSHLFLSADSTSLHWRCSHLPPHTPHPCPAPQSNAIKVIWSDTLCDSLSFPLSAFALCPPTPTPTTCTPVSHHMHTKTLKAHWTQMQRHTLIFFSSSWKHMHASMHTVLDCSRRVAGFIGGQDQRLQSCTEHIFNRVEETQKCFSLFKQIWLNI